MANVGAIASAATKNLLPFSLFVFFDISQSVPSASGALKYVRGNLLKRLRASNLFMECQIADNFRVGTACTTGIRVFGNQDSAQALLKPLFFAFT